MTIPRPTYKRDRVRPSQAAASTPALEDRIAFYQSRAEQRLPLFNDLPGWITDNAPTAILSQVGQSGEGEDDTNHENLTDCE